MKKRTLTAILMTAVLTIGMCMPALAANTTGGSTSVTFTQPAAYTVTIPANASVDPSTGGTVTITLDDGAIIGAAATVDISVAEASLTLKCDSVEATSLITPPADTKLNNTKKSCVFTLGAPTGATVAGTYTGTLNFTVGYTPAP